MKNLKNTNEEKLKRRYFILDKMKKTDPVLMSDRSFYSEAYGSFADICGNNGPFEKY